MSDSMRERRGVDRCSEYARANARAEKAERLCEELMEVAVESCNAADRRARVAEGAVAIVLACLVDAEEELETANAIGESLAADLVAMENERDEAKLQLQMRDVVERQLEGKLESERAIYESQLAATCRQRDSVAWSAAREILDAFRHAPWGTKYTGEYVEEFVAKYPKLGERG